MRRLALWASLCLVAVSFVAFVACDSDSDGDEGDPNEGQTFSASITAADGGTLQTDAGTAVLDVPAGALGADTELTVAVMAMESGTESAVFNFGPDGTTFSEPATLSLAFDKNVPEGQKAVLAIKEGGSWNEISGSSLSGGNVTGQVSHFSQFSVIFVGGEVIGDSDCTDLDNSFSACGGNPEGTWVIDLVCANLEALQGHNPLAESCPEGTVAYAINWVGDFIFDASTITMDLDSVDVISDWDVPMTCLATYQIACSELLEMLGGDDVEEAECNEEGDSCVCHFKQTHIPDEPDVSDYQVDGTELVTESDGEESRAPFCIESNKMTVQFPDDDSGFLPTFAVFTRQ